MAVNDVDIQRKRAQLVAKLTDNAPNKARKAQIMDLVSYETFEAALIVNFQKANDFPGCSLKNNYKN